MLTCAEEVLKKLDLPFRTMTLCTGDMGFASHQDLRHRGVAAGAGDVSRDFELLRVRGFPGAPHECALSRCWRQEPAFRPHPQRLRPRGRAHAGGGSGKLPERGWQRHDPFGACSLTWAASPASRNRIDMRILCTNDDGIHAPGLKTLEAIARALSDDVWVVAPETDQSGVSHSLSLNDPLRLREISEPAFRREGHADRLRHHGRAPSHARDEARPRPLRRQSRPERRGGRELFGHRRRRHRGHDPRRTVHRAVAGLWCG